MTERRFPLDWPSSWERTDQPKRAQFIVSLAKARDDLFAELRRMRASDVILSSNAPVNKDGQIRARVGDDVGDNGVCVYFTVKGDRHEIACDRWDLLPDNIRAVGLTIEALRGIERWGSTSMLRAAMSGFEALPPGTTALAPEGTAFGLQDHPWWAVLGVAPDADMQAIDAACRTLVKIHHPDKGGTDEAFHQLQRAYEQAKEARGS